MTDIEKTGIPFWTADSPPPAQYQWLDHDEGCDVAVIGAGVAGTLCAMRFAEAGVNTVLLAESAVGYGATAAAPGVISYQLDGGLLGLSKSIGMDGAVKVFELCAQAVDDLDDLCASLPDTSPDDIGFSRRDCFYYTTREAAAESMQREYLARRHNGFAVELLDSQAAEELFSFPVVSGIHSLGMAAQCDPYALCHAVAAAAKEHGARIYEHTRVTNVHPDDGKLCLHTAMGKTILASKVILAAGIEDARHLGSLAYDRTAFTLTTAPVAGIAGWHAGAVLVSDGCPPIRLRTTPDQRIIISGLDCGLPNLGMLSGLVPQEMLADKKYRELECILTEMFPAIHELQAEYCFRYSYSATPDSLPVIGEMGGSGIYYALCTGENGIAFANLAAGMLLAHYQGQPDPDMALFSPAR